MVIALEIDPFTYLTCQCETLPPSTTIDAADDYGGGNGGGVIFNNKHTQALIDRHT